MQKTKDFYTYVLNICNLNTLNIRFRGMRIVPSMSASRELSEYGRTLADVADTLEKGYDAPRRRKKGTIERWLDEGKKTANAVVVKNYDDIAKEQVWVLTHYGIFSKRL